MKEEGSSATDSVTDVTDVTDVHRKKEEGRGKTEEGSIAFWLKMRPFFIPNSEFTL